jgi:hypothetical protein
MTWIIMLRSSFQHFRFLSGSYAYRKWDYNTKKIRTRREKVLERAKVAEKESLGS